MTLLWRLLSAACAATSSRGPLAAALLAAAVLASGCAGSARPEARSAAAEQEPAAQSAPEALRQARRAHAQHHFIRGLTQAQLERYENAIRHYEDALDAAPEEPALLSAMAEAQAAQGDLERALYYAHQARRIGHRAEYFRQVAHIQQRADRPEEALAAYEALLARFPGDHDARLRVAQLQAEAEQPRAALQTYEALLARLGDAPSVRIEMLALYRQLGDDAGLERTLKALIDLRPDEPLFRRTLSALYQKQGRADEAARLLRDMIKRDSGSVKAVVALSELYRDQGQDARADALIEESLQPEEEDASDDDLVARAEPLVQRASRNTEARGAAIRLLEQALARDSSNAEAQGLLGKLHFEAGAFGEAAPLLEAAAQAQPRDAQRWRRAATAFFEDGRPRRAAAVADEGLLLFPGQLPLLRVAAYALMESNQNQAATQRFEEALRVLQEDAPDAAREQADLLAALGLLHSRRQDYAASDRAYERALAADPNHILALNNYAYSLAGRREALDRALEMAQRAVDLDGAATASFLDTLGWVYFQRGELEEAAAWLDRALGAGEASATIYEHRGDVAAAQGQADAARHFWREGLRRHPGSEALRQKIDGL